MGLPAWPQVVAASATLTGLPSILGTDMEVPVYSVLTPANVADVIADGGDVAYVLVDGEVVTAAAALTATRTPVSLSADNVTAGTAGAIIDLSFAVVAASRAPMVYWFATDDTTDPSLLAVAETAVGSEFKVRYHAWGLAQQGCCWRGMQYMGFRGTGHVCGFC